MWLDHLVRGGKSRRKPVFSFLESGMGGQGGRTLRTRVYVDGYNFYYGCLKGSRFKWLNLHALFENQILPSILHMGPGRSPDRHELLPVAVKYFTATIVETAAKGPDSVSSQDAYHTALENYCAGRLQIIKGYFSVSQVRAPKVDHANPSKWPRHCERVEIWKFEEKQSDVQLALHAYHDALTGDVDQVVIASNDTDLAPALQMIRDNTNVVVGLVNPTCDHRRPPNTSLVQLSHWTREHISERELAAAQLPRVVPRKRGVSLKPTSWYARPDLLTPALILATKVRGSKGAAFKWLSTPNEHLRGAVPLDLLESDEGAAAVITYMEDWIAKHPKSGNME
ncbi:antitoxin Xre/MbcA/ParS toxin-binding domain-containing protein [Cupriavidus sp. amp6]|uniref:antitoxin Xre/MbcA/ParS toxin-binding domain-containing protein n=1 Tax=Cupriavidus sp. amp6 TaxID=388051 RepID=UPI001E3B3ABA|nr:antitoxin Xre/MbcA/ParS toxin-binding domain-containing protein [Cupriavidus sp. amp6]